MELSFRALDDLAFEESAICVRVLEPPPLEALELGPLVELQLINKYRSAAGGAALPQVAAGRYAPALRADEIGRVCPLGENAGFLRLGCGGYAGTERTRLSIQGKRAAMAAGFDARTAGQLAAAILELADNIVEHSETQDPGLIAFDGADGAFEFVAADTGIGALASLRSNARYRHLASEREALPLVLKDGCSRSDDTARGQGFSDLFRGLANHQGRLRFRSGDAAVLIDGQSPGAIAPKVKAKPRLVGFMAAVHCVA